MREMKDSGIEWIGEIPNDWQVQKGKYFMSLLIRPTRETDEVITCFRDGEVTLRSNRREDGFTISMTETGYQGVDKGDLIVHGMDGFAGAIGISDSRGKATPVLNVLDTKECKKYLMYLMRSMAYCGLFLSLSTGIRVRTCDTNWKKIREIDYILPKLSEQQAIAVFLDAKCAEIDALSSDIQTQIDALEQYKRSVISESITKGLNSNATTKDSGVFYMAPMNANWKLTKIGYICTKLSRLFSPEDTALICSNSGKVLPRPTDASGIMVSDDNAMQGIHAGDIAIHGMDTWHGAIALSQYNGKITRVVHVCDSTEDKRFIVYYLQHLAYRGVYKLISNGVRGNTSDFRSWDKVFDISIAIPESKKEQKQICDYLDTVCDEIEKIIAQKQEQLDTLADYKKSLIYEYVTGKKEVPVP